MLHHGDDDLGVVLVAVWKQRADRAVNQPAHQRFIFAWAAFAFEVTTGDFTGGIGFFLVIHGQREKIPARRRLFGGDDRGKHDAFAVGGHDSAVSLAGDLARFEDERTTAPFDFYLVGIEHILSFVWNSMNPFTLPRFDNVQGPTIGPIRYIVTGKTAGGSMTSSNRQSCPVTVPSDADGDRKRKPARHTKAPPEKPNGEYRGSR